jgi:hypothetical protein
MGAWPDSPFFGLVVSRNYPFLDEVHALVISLPDIRWVCAETDLEARRLFTDLSVEPVLLPLDPRWKVTEEESKWSRAYDGRRVMRDAGMRQSCDKVYIFQKAGQKTHWNEWIEFGKRNKLDWDHLILVEAGTVKKPKRVRGLKPAGA